ncbi:pyridoxal phosphate-dependent aminotransferase [Thermococcus bergensis]|uniref:pyridoxal phosphate-dependent aminotransferase n=1 Tax=Thermococcus bergensis TaxID=2689387 RepID=UPI001CED4234|nr:pyridoxal phosphate-dependent aminotransferase [Thermococcus bergensis]MCA6214487.1 pyridoxal phosphate-dependent aminotransferase [Thermococcus bergensis]
MAISHILSIRSKETPASGIRRIFNKAMFLKDVIHLEIGEPDFDTPQHIKEAGCKAIINGYTHYTHNAGNPDLREAIANYYRSTQNINDLSWENVLVSVGGTGALLLSLLAVVDIGDEVLIPNPGYPPYTSMVKMIGAVPKYYPLREENSFIPNIEEIGALISEKTKAIIINTPNNPTGAVYPLKVLNQIAKLARDYDLVVISDEVYGGIIFDGLRHQSMLQSKDASDRVIVIGSFSKTYAMTGWRVGFAISKNTEVIESMMELQEHVAICAPAMAQKAAFVALTTSQREAQKMVDQYERRRDLLSSLLEDIPNISFTKPQGAFYLFLNISGYSQDSYNFAEELLMKKRVAVAPGATFGSLGEGYIRVSFANSEENIKEGVRRLKEFLGSK